MFGSEDLSIFFADFGVDIVFGAYSTKGNPSHEAQLQEEGGSMTVLGQTDVFEFATASLPGLKRGSSITMDGVAYRVREVRKKSDGQISIAFLEAP